MKSAKHALNEYLFYEFGLDADETSDRVGEDWPFKLCETARTNDLGVYEFDDDEPYWAFARDAFNFLPKAGMALSDLELQMEGARWITEGDAVSLSESRPGDADVPSGIERRAHFQELAAEVFGPKGSVLEGLFLRRDPGYVGLVSDVDGETAAVVGLSPSSLAVGFPKASSWRRLAWGVGVWLRSDAAGLTHHYRADDT